MYVMPAMCRGMSCKRHINDEGWSEKDKRMGACSGLFQFFVSPHGHFSKTDGSLGNSHYLQRLSIPHPMAKLYWSLNRTGTGPLSRQIFTISNSKGPVEIISAQTLLSNSILNS